MVRVGPQAQRICLPETMQLSSMIAQNIDYCQVIHRDVN